MCGKVGILHLPTRRGRRWGGLPNQVLEEDYATMLTNGALLDEHFTSVGKGTLDSKKRIALTKAIEALQTIIGEDVERLRFKIACNKSGQILLSPEVTVPLHEAWLYKNKAALESVRRGTEEAGRGKARKIGSFAKHASEKID